LLKLSSPPGGHWRHCSLYPQAQRCSLHTSQTSARFRLPPWFQQISQTLTYPLTSFPQTLSTSQHTTGSMGRGWSVLVPAISL